MNILNSKELFDEVEIYDKHKEIELLGCASVIDLNLFDEFDYDHYVRIAFQDWNLSIIGLIAKSTKCRARYNLVGGVNKYKFWCCFTLMRHSTSVKLFCGSRCRLHW